MKIPKGNFIHFFMPFFVALSLSPTLSLAKSLIVKNANIIDVKAGKILKSRAILINAGKIKKISKEEKVKSNIKVINAKGAFVLPGLIDAHVHLASIPSFRGDHAAQFPKIKKDYLDQVLKSYLYFGFTTLIDLAVVDRQLIDDLKKQKIRPQIFDCDGPLALANGYPMSFLPPKLRFKLFRNFLYDKRQADTIPKKYRPSDHTPKATIKRAKENGAICLKVHHEKGFAGKKLPTPNRSLFRDVVSQAKKFKLPLLVHANSYDSQKFAFENGAKIFVHGMWNWPISKNKKRTMPNNAIKLSEKMARKSVATMPTVQVLAGNQNMFDPNYLKRPEVQKVVPKSYIQWIKSKKGQWFKEILAEELEEIPGDRPHLKYEPIVNRARKAAQILAKSNARILFGSDTPASPTYGNLPGLNGFDELNELENADFSTLKILQAATIENARAFGLEKRIGSIEVGKRADLLLLKKNPLESMKNINSIKHVIVGGKLVKRVSLEAK